MKIGVTGPKGRLARFLIEDYNCVPIDIDITDIEAVKSHFIDNSYDVVINAASFTGVDLAELKKPRCLEVNTRGAAFVRTFFKKKLIQVSTMMVFNGRKNIPYVEKDIPMPINHYGLTKFGAEAFMLATKEIYGPSIIVRTTTLFGSKTREDMFYTIIGKLKTGALGLPTDIYRSPTHYQHLAQALVWLAIYWDQSDIFNITSDSDISLYEFGRKVADSVGLNSLIIKNKPDSRVLAQRQRVGSLNVNLAKSCGIPIYTLDEAITLEAKNYEK